MSESVSIAKRESTGKGEPHLTRTLTLRPVVLFGLAYLAPMIVLGTFGVLADTTHGSTPTAYMLALVALLFTALSYGKMSARFPVAGSAYAYTRRAIDSRLGFLVGWAVLLDYFFLPMVIWLIGAAFLSAKFPNVPTSLWIIGFIIVTSVLNVIGIKAAANANLLLMLFQIIALGVFVVLSLGHVFHGTGASGLLSSQPYSWAQENRVRRSATRLREWTSSAGAASFDSFWTRLINAHPRQPGMGSGRAPV